MSVDADIGPRCETQTHGLVRPKHALYQTELIPDILWWVGLDLNQQCHRPRVYSPLRYQFRSPTLIRWWTAILVDILVKAFINTYNSLSPKNRYQIKRFFRLLFHAQVFRYGVLGIYPWLSAHGYLAQPPSFVLRTKSGFYFRFIFYAHTNDKPHTLRSTI